MKRKIERWLQRVHDLNQILKKTLKKVRCDQLEWNTKIGLGDAAATGTFTGVVWGIQSCIVAVIAHYISLRSMPHMNVIPNFQNKWLETRLLLHFRFRVGSGIIAVIHIYFNFIKKIRKEEPVINPINKMLNLGHPTNEIIVVIGYTKGGIKNVGSSD